VTARSAITGRFVSLLYALTHPRTTIIERKKRRQAEASKTRTDFPDYEGGSD
jgi:hypothetical protein